MVLERKRVMLRLKTFFRLFKIIFPKKYIKVVENYLFQKEKKKVKVIENMIKINL